MTDTPKSAPPQPIPAIFLPVIQAVQEASARLGLAVREAQDREREVVRQPSALSVEPASAEMLWRKQQAEGDARRRAAGRRQLAEALGIGGSWSWDALLQEARRIRGGYDAGKMHGAKEMAESYRTNLAEALGVQELWGSLIGRVREMVQSERQNAGRLQTLYKVATDEDLAPGEYRQGAQEKLVNIVQALLSVARAALHTEKVWSKRGLAEVNRDEWSAYCELAGALNAPALREAAKAIHPMQTVTATTARLTRDDQ